MQGIQFAREEHMSYARDILITSVFIFFAELKNFPSFFIYHTHDDVDIADPSSTQDACHHMNFV